MSESWSGERAERHLRSLELFGMRFGLDRIRRMMTVLGSPQRRFRSVHVVGTNGKTSTTRMIAAILQRHGLRTGAYLSPHLISYSERVQVAERDISSSAFAAAVARAAWAAERVNRTLAEDDHVTQFELLTAAAFWALAEREVEVAVVEAGLGGRYDATAVIESAVTVLTNVGLEHTRWLGPTVRDIATEKLAVLRPAQLLAPGEVVTGAVRVYAGYLFSRNLALGLLLLVMLRLRAWGAMRGLMVVYASVQFLDAIMDAVERRWAIIPVVVVLGALFVLGAARVPREARVGELQAD
ncbi:MAG: Mur ligase family protein [Solirubrobacteraceae bacterium]